MNSINRFLNDSVIIRSKIGYFSEYYVYVNTNDSGNIPHFHIKDNETKGKKFHSCIQLEKNNYFLHEGKMDVLSSGSDRRKLQYFMNEKPTSIPKEIKPYIINTPKNNWLLLCEIWNSSDCRSRYIDLTKLKQPDYSIIHLER